MGKFVTSEIESAALRTVIDQRRNKFSLGPLRLCVELFRVLVPPALVRDCDLCKVVFEHGFVEVDDELDG